MDNKIYVELEDKLWKLLDDWKMIGVLPYQGLRTILYLLAIKRVLEERVEVDIDNIQRIMDLQRSFYSFREGVDENIIFIESGKLMEDRYNLPQGLFNGYFGNEIDGSQWKNMFHVSMKRICDMPVVESSVLSKIIEKMIIKVFQMQGYKVNNTISSISIAELFNVILEVKDGESFCDGVIGCGVSANRCVEATDATIWGMDYNNDILQMAALYLIISEKKNFRLEVGDFTLKKNNEKFDKIAMDIPFGIKVGEAVGEQIRLLKEWVNVEQCKDMDIIFVAKILDILKDKGRAAIVVTNGFLFRTSKAGKSIKQKLIEENVLKMVISLPPLHYGTNVKSSIIVLEKNDGDIQFIDLDSDKEDFFQKQRRDMAVLTAYGKEKLKYIIETKEEIEGVSYNANANEIKEKEYDLSPSIYLTVIEDTAYRTIENINDELKSLYRELQQIDNENLLMKLFN